MKKNRNQKRLMTDHRKNTGSKGLARNLHNVFTAQPMKGKKKNK